MPLFFKRIQFIALLFIVTSSVFAQEKELTLDDAVMQQYRKFYPQSLTMFSWIPNTDCYTYLEGYRKLMKADVKHTDAKEILTIQDINTKLGAELSWFSGMEWKNENEFWVNDGLNYYRWNLVDNGGEMIHGLDEKAENATFNTSSENVAYTIENNLYIHTANKTALIVTNNTDKNIVSGQAIARSEFGITNGIFWSPNGKLLAFYQKDETEVHDYPLLNISTTPGEVEFIKYPMTGQKSEKPRVGIFNIETKQTVFISPRGKEDDYLTNLVWTPDNKYVVIAEVNRGQNHYWLNVYDAITGEFVRTLLEETNEKWVEPEHTAFFPNDNSNNFVWISEKSGFNNLYYYDFNGKLIQQLTNHSFVIKDILTARNGKIYYSTTGESPLDTKVYSVDLKGKVTVITKTPGTHSVEFSTDGRFIHDHFSSHDVPSKDMILSAKGKIVKELMSSENALADYKIGSAEIGSIEGKDGTKLYTRLIKPSDFDPTKKYPVLVYVYGGPHAQMITNNWMDGASLWMYWMAEQGYLVFTLDNRGSGERGFAFESQIHRQCGTVEMEDQISGVDYLKSLPYVDGNRLAVHGWSYGGFMTTSLMLRNAGVYNVGVAGGPVTDWKYYEAMYGERYMDTPEENPKGFEEASLLTHAKNLEGDLLLIHGTIDDVVVMQHNFALVQKFVELGIQMDFFPYPMHKHNVSGKDRVHLMTKVLNYVIEKNQ